MSKKGASKKPRRRARKKQPYMSFLSDMSVTCYGDVEYSGETFPLLSAGQIGRSATAIVRLHDRKLLTKGERNRAWKRLTDEALK